MIKIQNIYYMLSYVYKILKQKDYQKLATEDFKSVSDFSSEVFLIGLSKQIKRGLDREYITIEEETSNPRGKILISKSVREQSFLQKKCYCESDKFFVNTKLNQVLKCTLLMLLKEDISKDKKNKLKRLLNYFSEVDTINPSRIQWNFTYNRNNQTYRLLIGISYLIIKNKILNKKKGKKFFMDFDEERKSWLYENFVLEFYKQEFPQIKVHSPWIKWKLDDDNSEFLPMMKTDIVLEYKNRILIIDTKFYSKILRTYKEKQTFLSSNIYQIFSYVKNKDAELRGKDYKISGMLLYAATDEEVKEQVYQMDGNKIFVKTLNLNEDFSEIRDKLIGFVRNFTKI